MRIKIDETTIAIMKHLRDGRKSFREIADDLSVSENTIRARVKQLQDAGILDISGLIDPEGLPGHKIVFVAVTLSTPHLVKKGEELSQLRGVVSSSVVTGRYDLILTVLMNDEFGLLEFFTEEFSRHADGIQSTETFVVYKGFNLRVPYIL